MMSPNEPQLLNKPATHPATLGETSHGELGIRERLAIMILGALVCAAAISTQSYWIDEAETVCVAILPTIKKAWDHIRTDGAANLQIPLYFPYAWAWEKVFGGSELSMRGANLPWFFLGLFALVRALKDSRLLCWGMCLAVLTSPFAWYYLNEARPYAIQLGTSLIVFAALYRLGCCRDELSQQRSWVIILCVGSLLLATSGLLAMLWLGAYLGAALLSTPMVSLRQLGRAHRYVWATTTILLLVVGLYYLWTLRLGARAAIGNMDLKTAMFIPYEQLGFAGLGPGRTELRGTGPAALRPWLPWLGIYTIVLLTVLIAGARYLVNATARRTLIWWAAAFLLVAAYILTVSIAVHFRVLGRHFMPLLPILLTIVAAGLCDWLRRGNISGKLVVAVFLGFNLASCFSLRWSPRHAKDDYRSAATLAREALARGQTVWWSADKQGALLYQLPLTDSPGSNTAAVFLRSPGSGFSKGMPRPSVVVTSKPDIFDMGGNLNQYLVEAGFQPVSSIPAFTIWRAPNK